MKATTCGCLDYDLSQGGDWQVVYNQTEFLDIYMTDLDDETKRKVVVLLCSATINDGDSFQVPWDVNETCS